MLQGNKVCLRLEPQLACDKKKTGCCEMLSDQRTVRHGSDIDRLAPSNADGQLLSLLVIAQLKAMRVL